MNEERIYTLHEAAEKLRVSGKTIYMLLQEGKLEGSKIGRRWRFTETQIMDFLKKSTVKVKSKKIKIEDNKQEKMF